MEIPLDTEYSNPLDVGTNPITRNWTGFIKVHLKRLHVDGFALLRGDRAFVLELEVGEKVVEKIEEGHELAI